MDPTERILVLVQQALDDFGKPDVPLSTTAQRALRIARLRRDWVGVCWLTSEVAGFMYDPATARLRAELAPHFTEDDWKQVNTWVVETSVKEREIHNLRPDGSQDPEPMVMGTSIAEIEAAIDRLKTIRETLPPPPGGLDLFLIQIGQHQRVLDAIRHRVHEYLSQSEEQLIYGQLLSDVFEKNRRYVDERLLRRSRDTYEQLTSAYERLREGSEEARAQAVTSCRRALKSLNDVLYPARSEPVVDAEGTSHDVTDAQFVNRLWQFVHDHTRDRSNQVLLASLTDLGKRVDALYDLASKGLHEGIAEFEANQCLIQTYLIVGDLLRLDDRTSAVSTEANIDLTDGPESSPP
jgi:hypothetical protein